MLKVTRLIPSCNINTVKDGRGGIFTFIPKDPVVEFNFMFIKSGNVRGNHFHPEFDEYFLLTSGEGILVSRDSPGSKDEFNYLSTGHCTHTPKGTSHVFYAITDCTATVLLTKKWDDCDEPIVHENLGMGTGDHGDPSSSYHK